MIEVEAETDEKSSMSLGSTEVSNDTSFEERRENKNLKIFKAQCINVK